MPIFRFLFWLAVRPFRSLFTGLLPLFVMGHFGHHLLTALPIPLLPMIRSEFGLDYAQSGLVVSAFTLAYGIGQVPAGWLTDRIGARIVITLGIGGVALAGILVGLSYTYLVLLVFMALMGVMGGGYHPAAPPIIAASVEPTHRGRALGLHMIGGSSSYFLAPLAAAAIATIWGWRGSFIVLAIPTLIFAVIFYRSLGRVTAARITKAAAQATPEEPPLPRGYRRRLSFFILMSTFTQATITGTIAFVPLYVVDQLGLSKEVAAVFIALLYSVGLWVGPWGGYVADRVGSLPLVLAVCLITGPTVYLFNLASNQWIVGTLMVILGIIMYVRMPVSESYIVSHTPARTRSTILGIYYFAGMEGAGAMTPVLGYVIDRFGFYTGFSLAGAAALGMTVLCSLWLRSHRRAAG